MYCLLTRPLRYKSALRPLDWEVQEDLEELLPNEDILPELTNHLLPGKCNKKQPLIAEVCAVWGETQPLFPVWGKLSCSQKGENAAGCTGTKEGNVLPYCLITEKEDKIFLQC